MSKRRNRTNNANIPQEALERARRQAAIERGEIEPEPEAELTPDTIDATTAAANSTIKTVSAAQRRTVGNARTKPRTVGGGNTAKAVHVDQETVIHMLENPTIEVTEEQLRKDYTYVVTDLRSMFILAGALMVTLVILAQVLPR